MTCRTLLPWPPSNKKPLQLSKMPLSLVGNFCSEKTRGSRWSRHPPGTPKDFKTNWIFMSWSFLRRLVKLFLPEDLRRPTCESFTYFPNWLCFKAFVWALPVHGDDLQIYIYIQCDMDWVKWLICFNWGFYPKQLVWCPGVPTSPSRFLIALLRAFMNRKKQHGSASLA